MAEWKNSDSKLAQYVQQKTSDESFPEHGTNYFSRFVLLDNYLNNTIHPHVNQGPTAREPIWLTDHGPDHIATVIRRASDLVFPNNCVLNPYECYLLLVAIHFHDIGNIFGRQAHERKCRDVMFELDETLVGKDTFEKRMICDIAMAHGGFVDEDGHDKDTIGKLRYDTPSPGSRSVRVKMLAAIVRFADELADEYTRTNRFVMVAAHRIQPGSEIYHMYADRLRRVQINPAERSIELRFELSKDVVSKKYQKGSDARYLLEEIMDRTLKMHREHTYCTRFMLPDLLIERINVQIDICSNDYSLVLGRIPYVMSQQGYPDAPRRLVEICPELGKLTGRKLRDRVVRLARGETSVSPNGKLWNLLDD